MINFKRMRGTTPRDTDSTDPIGGPVDLAHLTPRRRRRNWLAWIGAGLGVASALAGSHLWAMSMGAKSAKYSTGEEVDKKIAAQLEAERDKPRAVDGQTAQAVHSLEERMAAFDARISIEETETKNFREALKRIEDTVVRMDGKLDDALAARRHGP